MLAELSKQGLKNEKISGQDFSTFFLDKENNWDMVLPGSNRRGNTVHGLVEKIRQ